MGQNHDFGILYAVGDVVGYSIDDVKVTWGLYNYAIFVAAPTPVPIPPALLLFLTAIAALGLLNGRRRQPLVCAGALLGAFLYFVSPANAATVYATTSYWGDVTHTINLPHVPLGSSYKINFEVSAPDYSQLPQLTYYDPPIDQDPGDFEPGTAFILASGLYYFEFMYDAGALRSEFHLSGKTSGLGWVNGRFDNPDPPIPSDGLGPHKFSLTYMPTIAGACPPSAPCDGLRIDTQEGYQYGFLLSINGVLETGIDDVQVPMSWQTYRFAFAEAPTPVPIPPALILFATAIAALGILRRRRLIQ